jgi:hypothetical protein
VVNTPIFVLPKAGSVPFNAMLLVGFGCVALAIAMESRRIHRTKLSFAPQHMK